MRTLLLASFVIPLAAGAQPRLGAALKFGVPFLGWFTGVGGREFSIDRSRRWSAGVSAELRLTGAFSVEACGMYQRVGLDSGGGYIPFSDRERGYGWEFPIVARLRLPVRLEGFRLFVEAGPSIHWLRTHTDSQRYAGNLGGPYIPLMFTTRASQWTGGGTFGGGVERRFGPLRFLVDARYTRWPADSCYENLRCQNPNQGVIGFSVGF